MFVGPCFRPGDASTGPAALGKNLQKLFESRILKLCRHSPDAQHLAVSGDDIQLQGTVHLVLVSVLFLCVSGACCQVADLALTLRISRQDLVGCVLANQARQVEESDFEETGLLRFGLVTLAGGEDSLALQVLWLRVVELSARCLGTAVSQVQGGPS